MADDYSNNPLVSPSAAQSWPMPGGQTYDPTYYNPLTNQSAARSWPVSGQPVPVDPVASLPVPMAAFQSLPPADHPASGAYWYLQSTYDGLQRDRDRGASVPKSRIEQYNALYDLMKNQYGGQ